jgi:hypothetical protein
MFRLGAVTTGRKMNPLGNSSFTKRVLVGWLGSLWLKSCVTCGGIIERSIVFLIFMLPVIGVSAVVKHLNESVELKKNLQLNCNILRLDEYLTKHKETCSLKV